MRKFKTVFMRGGTSKGCMFHKTDLPENREEWDSIFLQAMGNPDPKQIDGLGGSQSVTSKVAIVKKSDRPDADVDYTFAQVSVDKPLVSYKGNCGNNRNDYFNLFIVFFLLIAHLCFGSKFGHTVRTE